VSLDTGTPGRDLQRHYDPPTVIPALESRVTQERLDAMICEKDQVEALAQSIFQNGWVREPMIVQPRPLHGLTEIFRGSARLRLASGPGSKSAELSGSSHLVTPRCRPFPRQRRAARLSSNPRLLIDGASRGYAVRQSDAQAATPPDDARRSK
jgi:hypothetical protein